MMLDIFNRFENIRMKRNRKKAIITAICLTSFFIFLIAANNPSVQHFTGLVIETLATPTQTTVTANFSSSIGVIRPDFYGVNTHGSWLGDGTMVDANGDGILDTSSDLDWNRQAFLDSGMKYIRWDINLVNYYSEGAENSVNFTGSLTGKISQLQWAHNNGIRVLLIVDYMPDWLANTSFGCRTAAYCLPKNYTLFGQIVTDYISRLTINGTYASDIDVEVWNEPYGDFFLDNISYDSQDKIYYYDLLYGAVYDSVKSRYPSIAIGGPSGYYMAPNSIIGFLASEANKMDFVSMHPYLDNYESNTNGMKNKTQWLINLCDQYDANCTRIINSEWNVGNVALKSDSINSQRYSANIAEAYSDLLNNWPSIVSNNIYQWSSGKIYSSLTNYPDYPQLYSMVSEPQIDDAFYPSYNITKDFATYHSFGSTVVSSNSSNSNVKVVASSKDGIQHITVINTGVTDANVSINLQGTNITNGLMDVKTGDNYTFVNGIANVGLVTQYGIKYLVSTNIVATTNTDNPETPSNTGSPGGSTGSVIVDTTPVNNDSNTNSESSGGTNNNSITKTNQTTLNNTTIKGPTGSAILDLNNKFYLVGIFLVAGFIVLVIYTALTKNIPKPSPRTELVEEETEVDKEKEEKIKKLVRWIHEAKKRGYNNDEIEKTLMEHGWDPALILETISHIDKHKRSTRRFEY